jgi:uncharacterized membrane protein
METEIAGWLSIVFRFVHVLAAIMWIGNSILFTWMELNMIPPKSTEKEPDPDLIGHLDMLHGGGVFHLEKRVIKPTAIPVPLHWFMWQSYTTWISGILLLITVYYIGGGSALLDATKTSLSGLSAIGLSLGGLVGWWLVYDMIWNSKLKEHLPAAFLLTFSLILIAAYSYNQVFNGRSVYLQIGVMLGSAMSANVFFHIIRNQKKFMASLLAGLPHDLKYGKQAKMRSLHNHYMTFPVLFMMLSAHSPQLTSASHNVAILGVIILGLMAVKYLMNSRYHFRHWLAAIFGTILLACGLIGALLVVPYAKASTAAPGVYEGSQLFVSQGCAACHQMGSVQIAPDLHGVFGSVQILSDGAKVLADEVYLRTSITRPQSQVVRGYAAAMPSYGHLSELQVAQLVAYIKSLE